MAEHKSVLEWTGKHLRTVHHTDFLDNYKRRIGVAVQTNDCIMIAAGRSLRTNYYDLPPGRYYAVRIQATRSGKDFGPHQSYEFFTTAEEREKRITGRINSFKQMQEKRNK